MHTAPTNIWTIEQFREMVTKIVSDDPSMTTVELTPQSLFVMQEIVLRSIITQAVPAGNA